MSPEPAIATSSADEGHGGDEALLYGWGGTAPTRARVVTPLTDADAIEQVRTTGTRGVIGRGLGRAYG
ncbi:MAG: decaprenylphosphoryl-beta-D-ribose oxidase, partial [Acidimicrobiia bacterium]